MGVSFPRFWELSSDRQVCSEHPYLQSQILSADLLASRVGGYRCVPPHLVYIAQGLQPGLDEGWASTQPPELYTPQASLQFFHLSEWNPEIVEEACVQLGEVPPSCFPQRYTISHTPTPVCKAQCLSILTNIMTLCLDFVLEQPS